MKRFAVVYTGALTALAAMALLAPTVSKADDINKKTVVTIDQPTEAPGIVLQPGKYVMILLNSSSNRHITEIFNEKMNHLYALAYTAAAERVEPVGKTVVTFYEGKDNQPQALRKWFWPGDTIGQEFIYPKDQAAKISARVNHKVPEGDLPKVEESGQKLVPDNANGLSSDHDRKH